MPRLEPLEGAPAAMALGYALDCRRYSGSRYRELEIPAAQSRIPGAGYCR